MNILALDTTTLLGSIAVVSDGLVHAESSTRVRATHSEELLSVLHEVLRRANLPLSRIDALAVGIGPGSFTGVRIGMATARGLQIATGLPLYGVSSLDALASSAWAARGLVVSAIDARRGEVFASVHSLSADGRTRLTDALYGTPESVGARVLSALDDRRAIVVGDLDASLRARLTAADPLRFSFAPPLAGTPIARYLALEVLTGRAVRDDGTLEPIYLRDIDAKLPRVPQVIA